MREKEKERNDEGGRNILVAIKSIRKSWSKLLCFMSRKKGRKRGDNDRERERERERNDRERETKEERGRRK